MAAITTDRLTKRFSSSTTAVDHVNITVEEGEVYGLLGRNGAGKSTLMGMLLGLLKPTSGSFQIFGRSGSRARMASDIGALIESPAFYPFLSARRNLEVLARYCGASARDVGVALERVGLDDVAGRRFSRFSLGMKQRLGVAAAILGDPALVILDEPTKIRRRSLRCESSSGPSGPRGARCCCPVTSSPRSSRSWTASRSSPTATS